MITVTVMLTEKEAKEILESDSSVYPPEGLIEKLGVLIRAQATLEEMTAILNVETDDLD